ncbi:uncharacterized protein GGS22DRAFT_166621 [Annulohypoxylon maeteangense]|uniref:uncharacterized protein n=1 Tax=Annulohypoxylon maeteangense TaxID=1927788 RepID=UPI002007737A|nr:uncharacterized protein GGS22DRAFT_166621 [Annulohypoxylon maeteangense]KAI0883997.1 hypothetical protein GGS22DRAFT_166621 [Annulohypoxylon maeteangense]
MGNPTEADFTYEGSTAPPPYAPANTHTESDTPAYQAVTGEGSSGVSGVTNKIPQFLNAYFPPLTKWSRMMYLGEHAEQPFFAVTTHTGLSGKPMLEMHAGPTGSEPIIATAGAQSRFCSGKTTVVKLIPGGGYLESSTETTTFNVKETYVKRHVTYPFSIEVGLGKDTRVENFEWRGSSGEEVKGLDKSSWRGYKLVRLGSDSLGPGGERASRSTGASSDGKEVVAVYTANGSFSRNKVFKFQFLESGATGVLGEKFALAAVITASKIGYMEFIVTQSAAAS